MDYMQLSDGEQDIQWLVEGLRDAMIDEEGDAMIDEEGDVMFNQSDQSHESDQSEEGDGFSDEGNDDGEEEAEESEEEAEEESDEAEESEEESNDGEDYDEIDRIVVDMPLRKHLPVVFGYKLYHYPTHTETLQALESLALMSFPDSIRILSGLKSVHLRDLRNHIVRDTTVKYGKTEMINGIVVELSLL
jgi:hypothetical protein